MDHFNLNLLSEFLSLSVAIRYHRWLRNSPFWLFIPFLSFTLLTEIFATWIWVGNNGWLYNLYVLVQAGFMAYFFYRLLYQKMLRLVIFSSIVVFYIFCLIIFWSSSFLKFSIIVFSMDGLLMTSLSFLFLFFVLKINDLLVIRKMQPALWVTAGILAFFPMVTVLFAVSDIIRFEKVRIFGVYLDNFIPQVLSLIMYGCFAYSFYLSKWRQKQ